MEGRGERGREREGERGRKREGEREGERKGERERKQACANHTTPLYVYQISLPREGNQE